MITRLRRPSSLRLRLTLLATLVIAVCVALAVAVLALSLAAAVRANLNGSVRSYATSIAESRAATSGGRPGRLPASPGDPGAWAQVVDARGDVVASTANVASLPALYRQSTAGGPIERTSAAPSWDGSEQQVVAVPAGGDTVYAGSSEQLLSVIGGDLASHLLWAVPVVLAGGLAAAWLLLGRSLRPVEKMRAEAAQITAEGLDRRVPEPAADDELGRLARTLNSMLARLEDASARQRRFVADASHELRTPLAAVRTSLEVGLAHPEQAPWPTLARRAVDETARLQRLVDDLLVAAKSEAGTLVRAGGEVDVAELARAAVHGGGWRVPVVVDAERAVVRADPDALTRVVRNLVENAARHASTGVRVSVRAEGGRAVLAVADDGPGIPAEERERVFDRFVRLDADRARGRGQASGTGLGLSIVREIVAAHHGRVWIEDGEPGARAVVSLPQAP